MGLIRGRSKRMLISEGRRLCVQVEMNYGIRKLVLEVFQNLWFTPVQDQPPLDDKETLDSKVTTITDVVATALKETSMDLFDFLLEGIFKENENKEVETTAGHEQSKSLIRACQQIVDCLVEKTFNLDTRGEVFGAKLVSSLKTLHLFAKVKPHLLVKHVHKLQPFLNLKCETLEEQQMISCVAQTLETVVPLMELPDESFLASLEVDLVKLLSQQEPIVIASSVSCLGSIINKRTHNFKLIRDCFMTYFGILWNFTKETDDKFVSFLALIKRSLYIVGILLRYFDLTDMRVMEGSENKILSSVFETFLFYLTKDSFKAFALKAIGSICIRHFQLMLGLQLNQLYNDILSNPGADWELKVQVLSNIEQYLVNEESQMMKQDQEWLKSSKQENLKEMGDISSGMASTVIQCYLKQLLQTFIHSNVAVRQGTTRVIQLVLAQGLVHPVQIVPYLICMSTDEEPTISVCAEQQLQTIERKYPGFVLMKALNGILLSLELQHILQAHNDAVRGYRLKEDLPTALVGFLYSILQTKQQRRAILLSLLKLFDEQTKTSVPQLLYLADNIAHFAYHTLDEPLFIIHHINIMISVTGTNLLKLIGESLVPTSVATEAPAQPMTGDLPPETDEDEEEDVESLLSRVPEDTSSLQERVSACQGCVLLLSLKQHLKCLYNLNDSKIAQYSPSDSTKVFEKAVNRKNKTKFNPKATLLKMKLKTKPLSQNLGDTKKALLSEYLEFKSMVMRLDPYESEGEKSMQLLTVQKAARGGNSSQAKSPELVHDDGDLSCEQQTPTESLSDLKQTSKLPIPIPQTCKKIKKNLKRKVSK